MVRLVRALLGVAAAAAAGASAPAACRERPTAAEAQQDQLLIQARPAAAGLTRGVRGGGGREGEDLQCAFDVPVTITSHRLMQLQDAEGALHLHGNKQSWERWTLMDAGNSTVSIVSHNGQYLGAAGGKAVLLGEGGNSTRWRILRAGRGRVLLTSPENGHLGDWEGQLKVHPNAGEWEKWYINKANGSLACTSPQAEEDEREGLRERMLRAEELLAKAREAMGSATCFTTTTTTTTRSRGLGRCAVFGDPHFITFDGGHTTFVGDRVLWVVRSNDIWVQAVSRLSTGNFMGLAVGGPFLQGHKLVVYNASDGGALRAEWDGTPILQDVDDEFHAAGVEAHAWRSTSWDSAMHDSKILDIRTEARFDIGPFPERFTGEPEGGLFLLRLPGQVEITLTGVDFISAVITMPAQEGQSGYCGNFNGDAEDDYDKVAPSWNRAVGSSLGPVPASQSLFKYMGKDHKLVNFLNMDGESTDEALSPQEQPKECPPELEAAAKEECKKVSDQRLRLDCVFDICQRGAIGDVADVARGMLAAEVMEDKVNTQGSVVFMGQGQCLDSKRRRYSSFPTEDVKTEAGCRQLLQDLAFTRGVLGAELRRTSTCQVLVDGEVDLTKVIVNGRWRPGGRAAPEAPPGVAGEASASGEGIISGATEDPAWSCWAAV